jgi:hypothetical protein
MNAPMRRLPSWSSGAARMLLGLSWCWAGTASAAAQTPETGQATERTVVAATVNGTDITLSEVDHFIARLVPSPPAEAAERERLRAAALDQLVDQQLVLTHLEQLGETCSPRELDLAVSQFQQELRRQDQSLEDHCRARGISVAALLRTLRWQLSW